MTSRKRIQLSRRKGWRKPEGAIVVARPTRWGNPYIIGTPDNGGKLSRAEAVEHYRRALLDGRLGVSAATVRRELADRDLACWCPLDRPCHADVLLEVANQEQR
jgi:hypothetical protein